MEYYLTYLAGAVMPGWFAPLMWIYLGICVVALLYSLGERNVILYNVRLYDYSQK